MRFNIFLLIFLFLVACDDSTSEKIEKPLEEKQFKNLRRGSPKDFVYFSFDKGDTIVVTDQQNDLNWDIAVGMVNTYYVAIKTNGGVSGKGDGAAIVYLDTLYQNVLEVPSGDFSKDKMVNGKDFQGKPVTYVEPAIPTGSDKAWYHYDFAAGNNPRRIQILPRHCIVIRTAKGAHVKLKIVDYYHLDENDKPDFKRSGYLSFKYVYQADKSKKSF